MRSPSRRAGNPGPARVLIPSPRWLRPTWLGSIAICERHTPIPFEFGAIVAPADEAAIVTVAIASAAAPRILRFATMNEYPSNLVKDPEYPWHERIVNNPGNVTGLRPLNRRPEWSERDLDSYLASRHSALRWPGPPTRTPTLSPAPCPETPDPGRTIRSIRHRRRHAHNRRSGVP